MKSHSLIVPSLALAAMVGSCTGGNRPSGENDRKHPNIIFILTDDMGYGDVGVLFQNQRAKANDRSEPWEFTPNLDILAAQGALLTQQYCAAPVCAPSRASILTGLSQGHANVRDNQFDKALADNYTMASTLRDAGYSTAAIGKYGLQGDDRWDTNGSRWPARPLKRGFDYFLGYMRHVDGHEHYPKEGLYDGAKQVWEDTTEFSAGLDKCYTADLWTAAAKRWIVHHERGKDSKKPFFMYLAYDTPHAVLELPTQAYPDGGGLKGGMQWLGQPGHMISTASDSIDSWVHPDYAKATWDDDHDPSTPEVPWPDVYKRYATATRRIDQAVGDIVQLLKDLHIDENTLIVFTSDNGPSRESYLPKDYRPNTPDFFNSFGPFDGIKRDCWEGGMRMPVIAWWPGHIASGKEITTPGSSYDWAPTFLDAAGFPAPAIMDGISLLPELTEAGNQRSQVVYVEYFVNGKTPAYEEFSPLHRGRIRNQMQVIRSGDLLGVRYDIKSAGDDFEIYNVVNDPQEIHNLAGEPGMDTLQVWMKARTLQMRRPNASAPRPYDSVPVPAVNPRNTGKGIVWHAYSGEYPWVPGMSAMQDTASGTAPAPDGKAIEEAGSLLVSFEGFLNIPTDGTYTFYLSSNSGAVMRIHDATVIDADYNYTPGDERKGSIMLKAGLHPFRISYQGQKSVKPFLDLEWSSEGMNKARIPEEIFYHAL